jgi:hypothetical protein
MRGYYTTSYVSRMCGVPLLVARAGLMQLVDTTPTLGGPNWELRLQRDSGRVSGVLVTGWAQRAAVDVEIEAWSRARVLVGLRHRSKAVPWWSDSYFTSAHEAVAHVTVALENWADEPLRTLLAGTDLIRSA